MSSLPAFVGVSIGMTYDDVATVYREIEKDKHFHKTFDRDGSGVFTAQSKDLGSPAKDDTVQIDLNFHNRSIQILHLVYGPDKWTSIAEAVTDLSRRIGVEEAMWEIHNGESAILKCTDFRFFANSQGEEPRRQNTMSIHPDAAKAN